MTVPAAERTLPIRVPILAGESLDSWLEALARRNGISIRRLLPVFGWRPPWAAAGLVTGVPDTVLRRAERQAGLPAWRLDEAVLDRYLLHGAIRRDGSRYCPQCLAEHDGRWLLTWRMPWEFACTTHGELLHDTCPGCGQLPRGNLSWAGLNPAATCPAPTGPGTRCEADLRAVPPQQASSDLLTAQRWISTLTAPTDRTGAASVLNDLTIIAGWTLRHAAAGDLAAFGPQAEDAWQSWSARQQPARAVPPSATLLTGVAAALTMPLIKPGDEEVIRQIRAQIPTGHDPRKIRPPQMAASQWHRLSETGRRRFLQALDPLLNPLDRLRHRSATTHARLPDVAAGQLAARARQIPQLLWPGWTIRLMPAEGFAAVPFRSAIATSLLLPGKTARAIRPGDGPHATRSSVAVNTILRTLTAGGHDSVLAALTCLAAYLDDHGSPIDYQRRRDHIPADTLTKDQWIQVCQQASAHPGETRRFTDARRYLYELLTGADLSDSHSPHSFTSRADKARYLAFTDTLITPLRAALHSHAARLLDSLAISEPLTWEPPASCCAAITLPGPDPADIDLDAVATLVITSRLPPGKAARQLGTTISHVRLALEQIHRPAPAWPRSTPPAAWQWQEHARELLTREFFEREYIKAGKTLRQLEAETGIPRKYIADRARQHGIILTNAFEPLPIDPGWLREQYITRQRSYTDIAAELRVTDVTVIAAARRHGIASRPPGVHSRPEMITTLSPEIPRDIRQAAEGSLRGWHRLHRFQAAMAFPTIEAAAAHLGTHQSALIHQFHRLERDIGGQLYHRSTPGQPMRPTNRGTALLQALNQPSVRAIAAQQSRAAGEAHPYPVARRPARAAKGQP